MTDLGAGVVEYPDEEPAVNGRPGPLVPRVPTCPRCGNHDRAGRIDHPEANFFCSCGTLFLGTELEWRQYAKVRQEAAKRRDRATNEEGDAQ